MNKFKRVELLPQEKESLKNFILDTIEENSLDELEENPTGVETIDYIERVAEDEENQDDFLYSSFQNYIEYLEVIIYQSLIYGI